MTETFERRIEMLEKGQAELARDGAHRDAAAEANKETLSEIRKDVREARDLAREISGELTAARYSEQLSALREKIQRVDSEYRADLQNAVAKAREEGAKLATAVRADFQPCLDDLAQRKGGSKAVALLQKNGGWLIATITGLAAIYEAVKHP